jgi:hypothetical protein
VPRTWTRYDEEKEYLARYYAAELAAGRNPPPGPPAPDVTPAEEMEDELEAMEAALRARMSAEERARVQAAMRADEDRAGTWGREPPRAPEQAEEVTMAEAVAALDQAAEAPHG